MIYDGDAHSRPPDIVIVLRVCFDQTPLVLLFKFARNVSIRETFATAPVISVVKVSCIT